MQVDPTCFQRPWCFVSRLQPRCHYRFKVRRIRDVEESRDRTLHCFAWCQSESQGVEYPTWTMSRGCSNCIASQVVIIFLIPPLLVGSHEAHLMIRTSWEHDLIQDNRHIIDCWCAYFIYIFPCSTCPRSRVWSESLVNEARHQIPAAAIASQPITSHTPPVSKAVHHFLVDLE